MDAPPHPLVVPDANILIPFAVRDTLLLMAESGLCLVRWTDEILEETRRNLVGKGFVTSRQANRLLTAMRAAFPGATIFGYEPAIPRMTNDPGDRDVLAAASHVGANVIITFNLRHFPITALAPLHLRAETPDTFFLDRFAAAPDAVTAILSAQAQERINSIRTPAQILDGLMPLTPRFAMTLRAHLRI